jgi:hypothetical protein
LLPMASSPRGTNMLPPDFKKIFLMARELSPLPNKNLRNWGFSGNECWLHFDSYHMPNTEEAFILALEKFMEGREYNGIEFNCSPPKLKINVIIMEFK